MYNLIQIQDAIRGLPIQDVMKYARGANPDVPAYLALAELNRRKQIQETSSAFYGEPQTVREQIESSLTGAPQGQVNPAAAPQMTNPAATPPQLQTLTAPPPRPFLLNVVPESVPFKAPSSALIAVASAESVSYCPDGIWIKTKIESSSLLPLVL